MRTILFLAANPKNTERHCGSTRRSGRSSRVSKERRGGIDFKLVMKWAVTDDDLRRALLDHEPEIVHFSGHGTGAGKSDPGRDLGSCRKSSARGARL